MGGEADVPCPARMILFILKRLLGFAVTLLVAAAVIFYLLDLLPGDPAQFILGINANPDYYFGYNNPKFQALIETLNATTDDAKRKELAIEAQKILADDAVNGYLFELAQTGVWNAKLEGMWQNSPIEGVVLRDIHWVE